MIVCRDCGFENEDGEKYCAMCSAQLIPGNQPVQTPHMDKPFPEPLVENERMTLKQAVTPNQSTGKKFFVNCNNSRKKTYVDSPTITSFFCEGCNEQHIIDGFFWTVEEESNEDTIAVTKVDLVDSTIEQLNVGTGNQLVLEDVDTHMRLEVGPEGGVLGRYGTIGASYLQSDPRGRMVSGEHCRFKYEYGRWSIEHLSRTNDTVYNGRKLEHGYEEGLRDGKILTLANAISFLIRIS